MVACHFNGSQLVHFRRYIDCHIIEYKLGGFD
jgi:hypothetical protein